MTQIRVVIVDDSPTIRALLKLAIQRDNDIVVVGEAVDPYEARAVIRQTSPDVITLDVNMPRMSGLEFLERIIRHRPTPVIMVSSEVGEGGSATIAALAAGAIDCVAKPARGGVLQAFAELPKKIRAASKIPKSQIGPRFRHAAPSAGFIPNGRVLAIGASTGGVDALLSILSAFPANCPPTLITQHMPARFTASFAHRLDSLCLPSVTEAYEGAELEPGRVYLAPGGETHLKLSGNRRLSCHLEAGDPICGHRPSVDALFSSMARLGSGAAGLILTGMGQDGANGLLEMRQNKAVTFGQDESSSLVYGMPRAAAERGAVELQIPLVDIPAAVLGRCNAAAGETKHTA